MSNGDSCAGHTSGFTPFCRDGSKFWGGGEARGSCAPARILHKVVLHYTCMDQASFILTLLYTLVISAGVGFYVARLIF